MKKIYNLTVLMLVMLLFATTNVTGQNLLINGTFENGTTDPWTAGNNNTISIDSTNVYAGTYSAHGNLEQLVSLTSGTNYRLTCYGYNTTTVNTWVGIRDMTPGGVLVQNFPLDSVGYKYVQIDFAAPATGDHKFWIWGQAGSDYLSDNWVLLKEGTTTNTNDVVRTDKIKILNQTNQVTVNIKDINDNAIINIYNMTGQLIHTTSTTSDKTIIPNSTFGTSGSYFVQVSTKEYLVAKQVVILD